MIHDDRGRLMPTPGLIRMEVGVELLLDHVDVDPNRLKLLLDQERIFVPVAPPGHRQRIEGKLLPVLFATSRQFLFNLIFFNLEPFLIVQGELTILTCQIGVKPRHLRRNQAGRNRKCGIVCLSNLLNHLPIDGETDGLTNNQIRKKRVVKVRIYSSTTPPGGKSES